MFPPPDDTWSLKSPDRTAGEDEMNVLVVTSDPDTSQHAQRILELRGTPPVVVSDLEAARRLAPPVRFDLVILDHPVDDTLPQAVEQARGLLGGAIRKGFILLVYDRLANLAWQQLLAARSDEFLPRPIYEAEWHLILGQVEPRLLEPEPDIPVETYEKLLDSQQKSIRQRMEAIAAQKNQARFAYAAEGAQDGLWYVDVMFHEEGKLEGDVWFSPRFKQLLGFEDHELANDADAWLELVHPDDRPPVSAALDRALTGEAPYDIEYRIYTKNRELRWMSARGEVRFDEHGQPYMFAGSIRDITDQHNQTEALRDSEHRFRTLVEQTPEPVMLLSADDTIAYANPAALRMLAEWTGEEETHDAAMQTLQGEPIDRFAIEVGDGEACPTMTEMCLSPLPIEVTFQTVSGHTVPCEVVCAEVRMNDRAGKLVMVREITDRIRAEAERQAKVETLLQLLKSHERDRKLWAYEIHDGMIQYLGGGVMRLQALADPSPPDEEGEPAIAIDPEVRDQFEIILHLLKTALNEGRRAMEGLRPPALDQFGLVEAIKSRIERHRQPRVGEPDPPQITFRHPAEFGRLATILEDNLYNIVQESLNNAIRHGRPTVIDVQLDRLDNEILLVIQDNGRGFDPGVVSPDRFGLKGIRERASLLDGEAKITSDPQKGGTRIEVRMPYIEPQE